MWFVNKRLKHKTFKNLCFKMELLEICANTVLQNKIKQNYYSAQELSLLLSSQNNEDRKSHSPWYPFKYPKGNYSPSP